MGNSHLECAIPLVRNDEGKLPYDGNFRPFDLKRKNCKVFLIQQLRRMGVLHLPPLNNPGVDECIR